MKAIALIVVLLILAASGTVLYLRFVNQKDSSVENTSSTDPAEVSDKASSISQEDSDAGATGLMTTESMHEEKTYKDISEYPTNNWEVAEAGTKGQDYTLFRINRGLVGAKGHPDYPIRIGITIPVDSLQEENVALYAVEDMLNERLEPTGAGIQVMAISRMDGQQFKEFVFYTKATVDFKQLHQDLQAAFPKYEVQFYAEKDPQWTLYSEYVN